MAARPAALTAAAALLVALLLQPGTSAGSTGAGPRAVPGLEQLPWVPVAGAVGDWVRYRVGNDYVAETSYMTLAIVDREDDEGVWLEIRVARSPVSPGDLTVRALTRSVDGDLITERMLVKSGGGRVVELDMDTVPADESDDSATSGAGACADPESASCRMAMSRGLDVRREPETMVMSAAGSLRVTPIEVRTDDGSVMRFRVSEGVAVTGLFSASTFEGTHMELDGMGDGAEATMPAVAEVVPYDRLGDALYRGGAAGGALSRVGRLVNPDEAEREERARKAAEGRETGDASSRQADRHEEDAR
ncbi:MAG: hypothetical protein ACOCVR_01695 [Myxococcota bacterium]